jgi:hypothetical protein
MGFVIKSDRMVNSYWVAWRTWKWTKKLFFQLLDMIILNAYLLHTLCGGKMTHKKFSEILVRDLIVRSHEANIMVSAMSQGRPSSSGDQLSRLEVKYSQQWTSKRRRRRKKKGRHVCSLNKKTRSTHFYCKKCDVGLYVEDCFDQRHMRARVWALNGVIIKCEVTQFIIMYSLNIGLLHIVWLFFTKSTCLKIREKTMGKSFEIS